jgi:ankyrin repeat protein
MSAAKLHQAAKAGDVAALRSQLAAGAPVDARDRQGRTALIWAAESTRLPAVRLLLEAGADPNAADKDSERPLTRAMLYGTPPLVQALLEAGAEVNFPDAAGDTPLMSAVGYGSPKYVELLLAAGADVNARRPDGRTAADLVNGAIEAQVATSPADHKVLRLLLAAGAVLTPKLEPPKPPPKNELCEAAFAGDRATVRQLLDRGAAVEAADNRGLTPLWHAARGGHAETVRDLLNAGADPNAAMPDESALSGAALTGAVDCMRILLDAGADPNGGQPLLAAAMEGHVEGARLLLEAGANPRAKDSDGATALDLARESGGSRELVNLLRHRLGAPDEPPDPLESALAAFGAASRQAAYQKLVRRLTALSRRPPKPFRDREHEFRNDVQGVLRFDFELGAVAEHFRLGADYVTAAPRDERGGRRADLLDRLQDEARAAGSLLIANSDLAFKNPNTLVLFPTDNPDAVILAHGTNGNGFMRVKGRDVFLGPREIIAWLREMAEENPFVLTGCGHDVVAGQFVRPVVNAPKLARRMCQFCPDLIDGEFVTSPAGVAAALRESQQFHFWWD